MSMVVRVLALLVLALSAVSCAPTIPKEALRLSTESLQVRQMETRRFDTLDEPKLLNASAAVLQDIGFNITEANAPLGILVGEKERDATDPAQVTGAILIAVLSGVPQNVDKSQIMRASLVTRPRGDSKQMLVRITFQRIVYNTAGQVTAAEPILDPKVYQEFFAKLSKSVFLQANEI